MEILKYQGGENLEDGKILGYYPDNMEPLYKEKVKGVLYLGTE